MDYVPNWCLSENQLTHCVQVGYDIHQAPNLGIIHVIFAFEEAKQSTLTRIAMCKIVPECRALDSTPVEETVIDPKMRDDMSTVLKGLQHVYCDHKAVSGSGLRCAVVPGEQRSLASRMAGAWRCGL